MATREEIREGMRGILLERQPAFAQAYGNAQDSNVIIGAIVRMLWEYLHSQGIALKVDRELPEPRNIESYINEDEAVAYGHYVAGWRNGLQQGKRVGYEAIEPLIQEIIES